MDAVDGAPVVREEPEDVEVLLVPGRYAPLPIGAEFESERRESTIFDKDLRKIFSLFVMLLQMEKPLD